MTEVAKPVDTATKVNEEVSFESCSEEEEITSEDEESSSEEEIVLKKPEPKIVDGKTSVSQTASTQPTAASAIDPERFNPAPLDVSRLLPPSANADVTPGLATTSNMSKAYDPERFNPSPLLESRILRTSGTAVAESTASASSAKAAQSASEEESSEYESSSEEKTSEEEENITTSKAEASTETEVRETSKPLPADFEPERFNPSPALLDSLLPPSANASGTAVETKAVVKVQELEESSEDESEEEYSEDEEESSEEDFVVVKKSEASTFTEQQCEGKPVPLDYEPERFNPAPFIAESLLPPSANEAAIAKQQTNSNKVVELEESSEEESSEEESSEYESSEEERPVVSKSEASTTTEVQTEVKLLPADYEPERFNPAPFLMSSLLPPSANVQIVAAVVSKSEPLKVKLEESSEEEESEYESSEESSEEELEVKVVSSSETPLTKDFNAAIEIERFNPSPFVAGRLILSEAHSAPEFPERFNPAPFNPNAIIRETDGSQKPTAKVKIVVANESDEESIEEYISSEEEEEEDSSGEEIAVVKATKQFTAQAASVSVGAPVEVISEQEVSPVKIISVTELTLQPERFNPSPYVEHLPSTSRSQQVPQGKLYGSTDVERFNPAPFIESRLLQEKHLDTSEVERFNPSPFIESRLIREPVGAGLPKPSETAQPVTKLVLNEKQVDNLERFNPSPLILDRILPPGSEIIHMSYTVSEGVEIALQPKGAYGKLKELVRQETGEELLLASQAASAHAAPVEEIKPKEPRTAAEFLEQARRIAEDESISLHSTHMLTVRHLVNQQERLHNMLYDMRRQCSDVDTQVFNMRSTRYYAPQPTLKRKHKWSHLLR